MHTAPATLLLVLVPYLTNAPFFDIKTLILAVYCILIHYFSFGHNSLLDSCTVPKIGEPTYDASDPAKSHHPLVRGTISLHQAKNVILWGLSGLTTLIILFTFMVARNVVFAITSLFLFFVFGVMYNEGLSKESLFGFLAISICFTSLGAYGWFLSHNVLNRLGWLLIFYFFMTILFQISYSGHLKELELKERSNILVKMGASVEDGNFHPSYASVYGGVIKFVNVPILGGWLLRVGYGFDIPRLIWLSVMIVLVCRYLFKLIEPRKYQRGKELFNMSIMEILTIYTPIPLVLPWFEAALLMVMGILYFFGTNLALWRTLYPRV